MKTKMKKNDFVTIVVLNDGETFTDVSGCSICVVPRKQYESVIEAGGNADEFEPVLAIGLDQWFSETN